MDTFEILVGFDADANPVTRTMTAAETADFYAAVNAPFEPADAVPVF